MMFEGGAGVHIAYAKTLVDAHVECATWKQHYTYIKNKLNSATIMI